MAEGEIVALREALRNQFLAVEKLQTEIEEERKASASGTNEALSMILRLQEEKAIEKMEASQYRRMAEEKIRHAEETLRILEDVLFQKELEISSFKYQVQTYKHKLLSIFVKDPDRREGKTVDNLWLSTNSLLSDKVGFHRRNISLPTNQLEQLCSEIGNDYVEKLCENCKEGKLQGSSRKSSWEQIQYNRRVKDCIKFKAANETFTVEDGSRRCSWYSSVNDDMCKLASRVKFKSEEFYRLPSEAKFTKRQSGILMRSNSCLETEVDNYVHLVNGRDIFQGLKNKSEVSQELILEAKDFMEMPNLMSEDATTYLLRDRDRLDRGSTYIHQGKRAVMLSKDALLDSLSEAQEPKTGNASMQTDISQIKSHMKHLDDEIRNIRQVHSASEKKQLDVLIEVSKKVDMILQQQQQQQLQQQQQQVQEILTYSPVQSNMKDIQFKKSPSHDDYLITNFTEAMLSFSI